MKREREIPIRPAGPESDPGGPEAAAAPLALPDQPAAGPSPRQTLNYLRNLFDAHGLEAKSKLGQNYLIDLNLIDLIVRTGEIGPDDVVLEVGTGTGSLTSRLADLAGQVVTIEIDKTFHPVARRTVGERTNVTYLLGDCLEKKSLLNPEMVAAWTAAAAAIGPTARLKMVANLPYVIATPLISNLLCTDLPIERMVVMLQWEIAERLQARAGTKDYNALSVLIQSIAEVQTVRKVLPANFHPRPKVDSAIVMIRPDADKRSLVGDVVRFRDFLRNLYVHRRKNLRQGLIGWPQGRQDKTMVDTKLRELGMDGNVRAETLSVADHLRLCEVFTASD